MVISQRCFLLVTQKRVIVHMRDVLEDRRAHVTVRYSSLVIMNVKPQDRKSWLSQKSESNYEACNVNVVYHKGR